MQDPAPNTINNTLVGAHCTCPTKLAGFDRPSEPFILRSHHESETGVAPQVLWRKGNEVTVLGLEGLGRIIVDGAEIVLPGPRWMLELDGPSKIIVGTGRVVRNIESPPEGGCRTSVELAMDDVANVMDIKGFHQLFIYGKLDRQVKAYGKLAGIDVQPIA